MRAAWNLDASCMKSMFMASEVKVTVFNALDE
jgi:hypothetical protein